MRSSFALGAIGFATLLASVGLRSEGLVQGIAAYTGMYLGFIGKFSVQLSIAMGSSLACSRLNSPWRRFGGLLVLAVLGIGANLTDWSFAAFMSAPASNLLSLGKPICVIPVCALVATSAFLASICAGGRRQFSVAQMFSLVALASGCCLVLRTHGVFAFIALAAMGMIGATGSVVARMASSGSVAAHIYMLAGLLITTAGLFHGNELGWFDRRGFAPKLALYCDAGIAPLAFAVTLAAGLTLVFRSGNNCDDGRDDRRLDRAVAE